MPHFQYVNQEYCISEQNCETNQRTEVVHIYTCQGRNNLTTIMYFNCLTLYNHILFNNNYGIYCLYLNDVLLLIKPSLSKCFSTVREYCSVAICKQQFK